MSEALSITEIEGQHVELLPARTVLSVFLTDGGSVCPAKSTAGGGAGAFGNSQGQLAVLNAIPVVGGAGTGNPGAPSSYAAC
jgi:hypothetical protein